MSRFFVVTLVAVSLMACISTPPLGEGAGGAGGGPSVAGAAGAGAGAGGSLGTSGLRPYSPAEVQDALAQCDLAHGPAVSPATYGDKRALMLGAWIECPPAVDTVFAPAIVFAADGTWQHLLSDGTGGLVVGYGVENQGTYAFPYADDADPTNGDSYVTVNAASGGFLPTDYSSGATTFEQSPDRMRVIFSYLDQTFELWLVPL